MAHRTVKPLFRPSRPCAELKLGHRTLYIIPSRFGALWIAAIWMLRRVCRQVASHRPFAPDTTRGLTLAGVLILLVPAWQAVRALVWQVILFPHAPAETTLIHTFARVPEGGALRMMPDIDAGLLVAGLVLLVVAQAFRVGAEVQRDSDEIV